MQYLDAIEVVQKAAQKLTLGVERVSLSEAIHRRSSKVVVGEMTIPPFTNSAVDGFAVRSGDLKNVSVQSTLSVPVCGILYPGETPKTETPSGHVWAIMTGAPMPLDCDAAVKIEDTKVSRSETGIIENVEFLSPIGSEENLRFAGADFQPGSQVLSPGEKIRPEHLMALSALNISEVEVFKKPRVIVLSTGKELVEIGETLKDGQIYNSTRPFLVEALRDLGAEVSVAATIQDEPEEFLSYMRKLLSDPPDILVTTGAVSMGEADFIRPCLEQLGAKVLFHRISIRPGKPILFASFDSLKPLIVFGLPGNPISSVIGTRFFIEPFLRTLEGRDAEPGLKVRLQSPVKKPSDLRCFFKARLNLLNGEAKAEIMKGQPSFMIHPLLKATAWAVLPEGKSDFESGDWIEIYPPYSDGFGGLHA